MRNIDCGYEVDESISILSQYSSALGCMGAESQEGDICDVLYPRLYGLGMVPAGIIENNNHFMPLSPAAEKLLEEIKKCLCAKTVSLRNAQSSIGWADGTEDP